MEQVKTFILTLQEFSDLLEKISGGIIDIQSESGEWFYTYATDDDIGKDDINMMLSRELQSTVNDIVVDITAGKVAIICNNTEN